eukprot:m.225504 g.225504  ORF g.225504 m.225504 type:complete len:569 (-) comp15160_c0_seq2:296-2002(-)
MAQSQDDVADASFEDLAARGEGANTILPRGSIRSSSKDSLRKWRALKRVLTLVKEQEERPEVQEEEKEETRELLFETASELPVEDLEEFLKALDVVVDKSSLPQQEHGASRAVTDLMDHLNKTQMLLEKTRLRWGSRGPRYVMIVKKPGDDEVTSWFKKVLEYFTQSHPEISVFVPPEMFRDELHALRKSETLQKVHTWSTADRSGPSSIGFDFIVSLGGDGTLLHITHLFQKRVPYVVCFALGSLGFLTQFNIQDYESVLTDVIQGNNMSVTPRLRLKCEVNTPEESMVEQESNPLQKLLAAQFTSDEAVPHYRVLNEVVIDRGPSPYLTQLDVFIDDKQVTQVQGDGLIIATPTGSTAYSLAAGGSMIHPGVPCILITPICPHSLSFRPIVVPATAVIKVGVPVSARNPAYLSFDGRNRQVLRRGAHVTLAHSSMAVPTINHIDPSVDWFNGISCILGWNQREAQKPMKMQSPPSLQSGGYSRGSSEAALELCQSSDGAADHSRRDLEDRSARGSVLSATSGSRSSDGNQTPQSERKASTASIGAKKSATASGYHSPDDTSVITDV